MLNNFWKWFNITCKVGVGLIWFLVLYGLVKFARILQEKMKILCRT